MTERDFVLNNFYLNHFDSMTTGNILQELKIVYKTVCENTSEKINGKPSVIVNVSELGALKLLISEINDLELKFVLGKFLDKYLKETK